MTQGWKDVEYNRVQRMLNPSCVSGRQSLRIGVFRKARSQDRNEGPKPQLRGAMTTCI